MEEHRPNEQLREARNARDWTLEDVAQAIGASPLTVGRWERGEAYPGPYYRQKLSRLFNMSLEELGFDPAQNKRARFVKKQKAAPSYRKKESSPADRAWRSPSAHLFRRCLCH